MSFEVICIKDNWMQSPMEQGKPHPSFGECCNVVEVISNVWGEWYVIEGYDPNSLFLSINFAKVSNIDESARLEAWKEQQLTAVDKMLQEYAEAMPEVEMGPGSFERVWANVKASL